MCYLCRVSSYCFRTIKFLSLCLRQRLRLRSVVVGPSLSFSKTLSTCEMNGDVRVYACERLRTCVCVSALSVARDTSVQKEEEEEETIYSCWCYFILAHTRTHTIKCWAAATAARRAQRRWICSGPYLRYQRGWYVLHARQAVEQLNGIARDRDKASAMNERQTPIGERTGFWVCANAAQYYETRWCDARLHCQLTTGEATQIRWWCIVVDSTDNAHAHRCMHLWPCLLFTYAQPEMNEFNGSKPSSKHHLNSIFRQTNGFQFSIGINLKFVPCGFQLNFVEFMMNSQSAADETPHHPSTTSIKNQRMDAAAMSIRIRRRMFVTVCVSKSNAVSGWTYRHTHTHTAHLFRALCHSPSIQNRKQVICSFRRYYMPRECLRFSCCCALNENITQNTLWFA